MSKDKNTIEKKEIKRGIKAVIRHIKPFKRELVILVLLGIISAIANGFVPYVTGKFFDALVNISSSNVLALGKVWPAWAFFLTLWSVIQIVAANIDWLMEKIRRSIEGELQLGIQTVGFEHLFRLPVDYHKDAHVNGDLQKISTASWRITFITRTIITLSPQILSIFIGIFLAANINQTLALIMILGVVVYIILLSRILIPVAKIDLEEHKVWNESWNDSAAAVQQIESVKQATSEEFESKKIRSLLLGRAFELWNQIEGIWLKVGFFQRLTVFFTQLIIFILSVRLILAGSITIGELIALNAYAAMFFGPFVILGYNWQSMQNGIISLAQIEDIFDKKEEDYHPEGSVPDKKIEGEVWFKDVHFSYTENQKETLKGINFKAEKGQVIALVGESGVGKSTSISLISAYHFPTQGEVLIDGTDTRELDLINLRKHIAVVPQEVALFNDTIRTNIKYGSFDATDEEVEKVARDVNIHEFISELPDGYDSLVGERGVKLSVGQKQRVSIARAMLRNPSILILDEPTSALDAQTERVVTEALEKLMKDRTTFIIAHRLSTVRKADIILVFEKGEITETGTHEDLIQKENGVYRKLYEYQVGLH